jgi:hypothetical protein
VVVVVVGLVVVVVLEAIEQEQDSQHQRVLQSEFKLVVVVAVVHLQAASHVVVTVQIPAFG